MRELKELVTFLEQHQSKDLVLATIIKTEGSTYRKAGAKKLIHSENLTCGLISGGCLEGDIIKFALESPKIKRQQTFDTTTDEDRLFGSGVGCKGKITIEFDFIDPSLPESSKHYLGYDKEKNDLNIIVIGCGLDIPPLYDLVLTLGWNIQFVDYRTDWLDKRQKQKWPISKLSIEEIPDLIQNPNRTALLLMSHNYPYDLEVLKNTLHLDLAYTGVLGPPSRKKQMIEDLKNIYDLQVSDQQKEKLFGPLGLKNFGEGETAIALSVVSQLQQVFFGASH